MGAPDFPLAPVSEVFRAVVVTVVPTAADLDESGWRDLERLVADSLRQRPRALQRRLRLFLHCIKWAPLLLGFRRSFNALSPDERARVLAYLENHQLQIIRVGFWGLRALALMGYYGRPAAARSIGYTPDPAGWEAIRDE